MPQSSFLCRQMCCKSLQQPAPPCRKASRVLRATPATVSLQSGLCPRPAARALRQLRSAKQGHQHRGWQGLCRAVMEQAECSRMRPVERGWEPGSWECAHSVSLCPCPLPGFLGCAAPTYQGEKPARHAQHRHNKPLQADCQLAPSTPSPPLPTGGQRRRALAPRPQLFVRLGQCEASCCCVSVPPQREVREVV